MKVIITLKFILASEKNLLHFSLLQASWLYDLLIDFLLFYGPAKEKFNQLYQHSIIRSEIILH